MSMNRERILVVFCACMLVAFPGSATKETVSTTWQETMAVLRPDVIRNDQEYNDAAERLGLRELKLGQWFRFELSLFGKGGAEVWPVDEKPGHDYASSLEERFLRDGMIDLKAEYTNAIHNDGRRTRARFRRIDIVDDELWTSPHRHKNRLEYYYRAIEVETERSVDLYLGFCEGCKVFLNGREIFSEFMEEPRECEANQVKVSLPLHEGTNHLLIKLTSFRMPADRHNTYSSFNPVPRINLKKTSLRLFADFPRQADWFMQDAERMASPPIGADLNRQHIPKNMVAYFESGRGVGFEVRLIDKVLDELKDGLAPRKELEALIKAKVSAGDRRWLDLYIKACEERRHQRLARMKQEYPKILFVKRKMLRPSFYGYTEGLSCANFERNFEPGSSLCLLEWAGERSKVTELLSDEDGTFRDVDMSWDGRRILFAWKKSLTEDDYHLYEMTWPDRKVRQLTFGLGVADFEGCYLPNGDILFSSSRCISTTDCWTTEVSNLYTCDKDGKYLRRLGFDQVVTVHPSVLANGSVIYTRWDYNDRGQVFPQPLFQMNPDGTGQTEYYGNNSWFPTVIDHARGIPGTGKVLAVLHGHHTWQAGELAIIDRDKGTQETSGVQLIAPPREPSGQKRGFSYKRDDTGWINPGPGVGRIAVDRYGQNGNLHRHPYPLSRDTFVVAMTPFMNAREEGEECNVRFHLYWMDSRGGREMLAYDPSISSAHPIPLAPRKRPQVRPTVVDYRVPYGTYFVQDIYKGPGLKGIERGTIEKLRVVALEYRALKIGSNHSGGRGGGAMSSTPVSTGNGAWDVKRILGETKVYEDGSAMFKVPANTPVYFQAIDKEGSMVQTMRSWSTLMPNEYFGCIGCHEDKGETLPMTGATLAMEAGARELEHFYGPPRGFSFLREIQPILDKHCVKCHNGKKKSKETGEVLADLTDTRFEDTASLRSWTHSYLSLTHSRRESRVRGNADNRTLNWISAQSVPDMIPPRFRGSHTSSIVRKLRTGHGRTRLDREELDKFAAWIDLGVPFCGDYVEANTWNDQQFEKYIQMQRKRERLADEVRKNTEALIERQTGKPFSLPTPEPRYLDHIRGRENEKRL